MNKEDKERLEELKLKVWQWQAVALLQGKKNGSQIAASHIESHKGRRLKAVRLLTDNGYIQFAKSCTTKTAWGSDHQDTLYNILHFEDESPAAGVKPEFSKTWQEVLHEVYAYSSNEDNDDPFNQIGYEFVANLSPEAAIYIWWHKDEYDFERNPEDGRGKVCYPKVLQDTRVKAMLRSIVERNLSKTYHNRLETVMGLPKNSLPCIKGTGKSDEDGNPLEELGYEVEERTHLAYRNCGYTPAIFDQQHSIGMLEEYEYRVKYFAVIADAIRKFDEKVKATGGYEPIIKQMRIDIIQEFIDASPINMNLKCKDDEAFDSDLEVKGASTRFMLKHGNFFDYDTLYGTDASVTHINESDLVERDFVSEFKPDKDDSKIVSQFREEMLDAIHTGGSKGSK